MDERKLEERVDRLERMLVDMDNKLNQILQSSQNMDNHISFVEGVYNIIRTPLNFFTSNINNFMRVYPQLPNNSDDDTNLPLIRDEQKEN